VIAGSCVCGGVSAGGGVRVCAAFQTETRASFPNPFTVLSTCKVVVCPFVGEETDGSYPFENGLIGLDHL
jgi:hypothetical protein